MARKPPPGVTAKAFASALGEFRAAVGKAWVFTTDDELDPYRDAYSLRWGDADEYLASAAVAPDTVEQVQAIVRTANKYKIPLYPISTGKNLTYGGPAPTLSGSVVVDLKRMNRILKVDDKRNFCLVEPGVSYFDLYRYVKDKGLKVWIDCPDPGWGSPIGNALDHGVGYTAGQFRDHFSAHCGMEVVTPTGEVMRTGMGALPGADSWQDYRYGVGPWVDGLFSQANFGIVTKMGFWMLPTPETYLAGVVTVPNYRDLGPLVEQVSYLEDSHLTTGQPLYRSLIAAPPNDPDVKAMMAKAYPTDAEIDAYAKKKGGPAWEVTLQFYGPEKIVAAHWDYALDRISKAVPGAKPGAIKFLKMPLTPEQEKTEHLVRFGIPNMAIFGSIARKESDPPNPPDGHVDFLCVCPRNADAFFRALKVVSDTQRQMGVPLTATPFSRAPTTWYTRAFIVGAPSVVNYRDDPEKNRKGRALFEAYIKNMAAAGFGQYRTNPSMQDLLVSQFSFNNHALLRFQEQLKDGVDPNGVISPGRYGIWPKRMRKPAAAARKPAKPAKPAKPRKKA